MLQPAAGFLRRQAFLAAVAHFCGLPGASAAWFRQFARGDAAKIGKRVSSPGSPCNPVDNLERIPLESKRLSWPEKRHEQVRIPRSLSDRFAVDYQSLSAWPPHNRWGQEWTRRSMYHSIRYCLRPGCFFCHFGIFFALGSHWDKIGDDWG